MSIASLLVTVLCVVVQVSGHSFLTKPPQRGNKPCRIDGHDKFHIDCPGPCDVPKDQRNPRKVTQWRRGAPFRVEWPRNNHSGGFTRLAIVPVEQSDSYRAFDNNVFHYSCYEFGAKCHGRCYNPNDRKSPKFTDCIDVGPGGGGGTPTCYTDITIPTHLRDGMYTLQWTWYGGLGGFLGQYFSCADIEIKGGAAVTDRRAITTKFSDKAYPNENVCAFSQTNRLYDAWFEPAFKVYNSSWPFPIRAPQKGRPEMASIGGGSNSPRPTASNGNAGNPSTGSGSSGGQSGVTRGITLQAVNSGLCLEIEGASKANNAKVQQWNCHRRTNQQFNFRGSGDGTFRLINNASDKCLEVARSSKSDGAAIVQSECDRMKDNQRFEIYDAISNRKITNMRARQVVFIRSVDSKKYFDVPRRSTRAGEDIMQFRFNGNNNQQFRIVTSSVGVNGFEDSDAAFDSGESSSGSLAIPIVAIAATVIAIGGLAAVVVGVIVIKRRTSESKSTNVVSL